MTSPVLVGKNARRFTAPSVIPGFGLTFGYTLIYLGLIVLFPLATLIWWSSGLGFSGLYAIASEPRVAFARSVGEYGSVIFIAGNIAYVSEIAPLLIVVKLDKYDAARRDWHRDDHAGDFHRGPVSPEGVADQFASDLILPSYSLTPILKDYRTLNLKAV